MKKTLLFLLLTASTLFVATNCLNGKTVVVGQAMDLVKTFKDKNTKFLIKEDIDLKGKVITVGEGSVLAFKGGSLSNGTVVGNNTRVRAKNYEVFKRGYTRYRAYIAKDAKKNMPPSLLKEYHHVIVIEGTWANKKCGSNWTGLLDDKDEDVMLAVKNYVALHAAGAKVKLPRIDAVGYENTTFPGGYVIDFNNSTISYPDDLSIWEDNSIALPEGATPCAMESGYGFFTIKSNTTIRNLTVDGKSTKRPDEIIRLGVSCIVCVANSKDVVLENVAFTNVMGPAVVVHQKSKDLLFKNCTFCNIGEHVVYSHQYLGFCHFDGCVFDTWDSERLSVYRNGFDYVYKHTPYDEGMKVSCDELYGFDLRFTNCTFNNPERVNSQNRKLGGFLTGNFPVVVNVERCTFNGVSPILNPGGAAIAENIGMAYKMIVRSCQGAPHVYASKANSNIIAEYYDCKNIPFRTVYAKRYENCQLYLDLYEDNNENVSSSFEAEFAEPLVIKNCEFIDHGRDVRISHPVSHRPVSFENCVFKSNAKRNAVSEIITIKSDDVSMVSFDNCEFVLPGYRLVGGNKVVKEVSIRNCQLKAVEPQYLAVKPLKSIVKDND